MTIFSGKIKDTFTPLQANDEKIMINDDDDNIIMKAINTLYRC